MDKWVKYISCEDGKVYQTVRFQSGKEIEIPLDRQGKVKWFDDNKLLKDSKKR